MKAGPRLSLEDSADVVGRTACSYISNDFQLDVFGIRVAWAGFGFLLLVRKVRPIRLNVRSHARMLRRIYIAGRCR